MKSEKDTASLMYEILQKKEAIDRMSIRLNNGHKVFRDIFLEMPKLKPAELGLLRAVSWFYVLYNEAGKINVEFISDRFNIYGINSGSNVSNHLALVNMLRTYFQHNLDPSKPHDIHIKENCEKWFKEQCGTFEPENEDQWTYCLNGFVRETLTFFHALVKCIREIEQDESCEQILQDWEVRRSRYHPPHKFDELIQKTTIDMGRNNLDVVKFRKRFYNKWIKELETLHVGYDFEVEARKLIEHALLNDLSSVLPITGFDILATFDDIQPGSQIGELLEIARKMYEKEPCTGDQLLQKLKDYRKS